jgi:hypothetical protein
MRTLGHLHESLFATADHRQNQWPVLPVVVPELCKTLPDASRRHGKMSA